LPKYIFDGSWGKWGMRKLQEGMNEPDFDSRFGGIEATGPKCLISEAGMAAVVCRALQVFLL